MNRAKNTKRQKVKAKSAAQQIPRQSDPSGSALTSSELDGINERIRAATDMLINNDNWPANQRAVDALARLAGTIANTMIELIERGETEQGKYCARLFINQLVICLQKVRERVKVDGQFLKVMEIDAAPRIEFPLLISLFNSENKRATKFVLNSLDLGRDLPFKISSNRSYTPETLWAANIVIWINLERSKSSSIYRRIEPEIELKEFSSVNHKVWEKVIAFHLDYFNSPEPRLKVAVSEHDAALRGVCREKELAYLSENGGPKGEITEVPKFKAILENRSDKNVESISGLYNRAKNKIIDAARSLMR